MTPSRIAELEAICERATRPEWFARGRHLSLVPDSSGMGSTLPTNHIGNFAEPDDATFAATARTALPAALAEIRRLKAALVEACDIGAFLHAHKCPGYENGQCEFKEPMARIAELRKEAES